MLEAMTSTCVRTITGKLFSRNLISEDVQDQVVIGQDTDSRKAAKVLYSVKQGLKVDPGKLRTFVEILQEQPMLRDLTKAIMSEWASVCVWLD